MPEENHLVIGLGGTGCAVVRELHKLLFTDWHNQQKQADNPRAAGGTSRPDVYEFNALIDEKQWKTRIATLSVDSHEKELDGEADKWRVLGEQLSLRDTEKYLLQKKGLSALMENLSAHPGVRPWVENDKENFERITKGSEELNGCDQIRRLGKLVLANPANLRGGLLASVNKRIEKLCGGGQNKVTVHIAATLGCGTGSGTIVDTIVQLRKELDLNIPGLSIYLYVFITGSDVPADVGNFHANQYAALQELNALRTNNYKPWDISDEAQSVRLKVNDAFSSCFLISNVCEGGKVLSLDEQIYSAGEFLYQKFARLVGYLPKSLDDAHTFQDVTSYIQDDRKSLSGRSTRFAAFGVRRLGIPDLAIHKKLTLSFSSQGSLALIYRNWDSAIGFAETRKSGFDSDKFVREALTGWGLSREQLNLDVLPPYLRYADEWKSASGDCRVDSEATTPNHLDWVGIYEDMMGQYREKGFRACGVENFFKPKLDDNSLADRAGELVAVLERSLLEGWLVGSENHVTDNFTSIVASTRGQLERYREGFKKQIEEIKIEDKKFQGLCEHNDAELQSVGRLAKFTGKDKEIFHAYCEAARGRDLLDTERRAALYADLLIAKLLPLLNILETRLTRVDTLFKQLAREWTDETNALLKKPNPDQKADESGELVQYVDHDEIAESIKRFKLDKKTADEQVKALRRVLDVARGQTHDFAFVEKMLSNDKESNRVTGELRDLFERESYTVSLESHNQHQQRQDSTFKPVLRLNIVKKLADDHGGVVSGELRAKLREIMEQAMPSLAFDSSAQPTEHPVPHQPIHRCTVFVPQCAALGGSRFRDELCTALEQMQGNRKRAIKIVDIPEERNTSEIVFLSTVHFFPLRMAQPVVALSRRFKTKLDKDPENTRFLHFGETHRPELPNLMKKDDATLKKEALPYLILASVLELLHVVEGEELDDWEVVLGEKDTYGKMRNKLELGVKCKPDHRKVAKVTHPFAGGEFQLSLATVVLLNGYEEHFTPQVLPALKKQVLEKAAATLDTTVKRTAIKEALEERSSQVFVARGGKESDSGYKRYDEACGEAASLLSSLQ